MATALFLFCFVLVAAVPGDEEKEEEEEEGKRSITLCVVDYNNKAVLVSSEAPLTSSVCCAHARVTALSSLVSSWPPSLVCLARSRRPSHRGATRLAPASSASS